MKTAIFMVLVLGLLALSQPVFAPPVSPPMYFYGNITVNAIPAPTGTIVKAVIGSFENSVVTTVAGSYGDVEKLGVMGNNNDTILFYIKKSTMSEFVKANENSTFNSSWNSDNINLLNLTATLYCGDGSCDSSLESCSTCSSDCGECSGSGAAGGSTGTTFVPVPSNTTCQENWTCEPWSECNSGHKIRTCIDQNSCGTESSKPSERITCGLDNICFPGSTACVENTVVTCSEGNDWITTKVCESGCSEGRCLTPEDIKQSTNETNISDSITPGNGITGLLPAGSGSVILGAAVVIILIGGGLFIKSRKKIAAD